MYRHASPAAFSFCLHRQTDRPKPPLCVPHLSVPPLPSAPPACRRGWLHESKWDGFRFQVIKVGSVALPAVTAIIDGELCLVDLRGAAQFWHPCCLRHKVLAALRGILSQCGWVSTTNAWNLWRQPGYCCGLGLPFNDADGLMDGECALASHILLSL